MNWWNSITSVIAISACAGALGCGTSSPEEKTAVSNGALSGSATQTWTSGASPWGSVGIVNIYFDSCRLLCPNGNPPSARMGCGTGGGTPARQCSAQMGQCSASLIARDLVLSAAHCFCDKDREPNTNITRVTFNVPGAPAVEELESVMWRTTVERLRPGL